MATTMNEENPRGSVDQQQQQEETPSDPTSRSDAASSIRQQLPPSATVADSSLKDCGESKVAAAKGGDGKDDPVTDTQKKIRRAERFGTPVQLSEEEKRNSRAERFGTGPLHGSDTSKKSEEQKRKARAERFGLVQSEPSDEEAKKKARLARFGTVPKADPVEEDKKKARAIRFSQPPSDSLSQVNGKGNNVEIKTAIAGNAGGGT